MKRMKKLFAILMTMAMVMGLGITGFAAETTNVKIKVDNGEGAIVKYVQIVKADTSSTDGWSYVDDYADYFTDVSMEDLLEIGELEKGDENKYSTTDKINNSTEYTSSKLAEALEAIKKDVLENKITNVKAVLNNEFTVSKGGLYVLIPQEEDYTYSPTLVYVPVNEVNTDPGIEVDVKGELNKPEKDIINITPGKIEGKGTDIVDNDMSVTANDTVEYKVTINYPYFSDGAVDRTFNITDTVENGTYNENVTVKVGSTNPYTNYKIYNSEGEDITTIAGGKTFKIEFNYDPTLAGQKVEITYSVKVDSTVSETSPLKNTVKSTIGTEENQKIVITDTVGVSFDKIDATSEENISGAVFALYEGTPGTGTLISIIADVAEKTDVDLPKAYESYTDLVVKDKNPDGTFHIDNLDANKSYYIKEIVAPDGYKVVDTEYPLTPGGVATDYPKYDQDGSQTYGPNTLVDEYKYNDFTVNIEDMAEGDVPNTTLSALPSTGGMGTTIFTIVGCVIMISAAGLFFASRRKAN